MFYIIVGLGLFSLFFSAICAAKALSKRLPDAKARFLTQIRNQQKTNMLKSALMNKIAVSITVRLHLSDFV